MNKQGIVNARPTLDGDAARIRSGPLGSWVDGSWQDSEHHFAAISPAHGSTYAWVPGATAAQVRDAVASAHRAWRLHRRVSPYDRAEWCRSAAAAMVARADELAEVLSLDQGKPIAEARGEVAFAAQGFRLLADAVLARGTEGPMLLDAGKRAVVRREPLGVWAVVTPWNFPVNIPVEYVGAALATGNAAVWKPAPTTSVVAAKFREVLLDASFPQDLFQLILTDDVELAESLLTHELVAGVGFTGGSATGQRVAQRAWNKRVLLELGGNSPVMVLEDADVGRAAAAISNSAFWNSGQVCSAAGKILVHRTIASELAEALVESAERLVHGDPVDPATTMGPVHLENSLVRYIELIDDAKQAGAEILSGGAQSEREGYFFPATVLWNVPKQARIFREETFGPIASVTIVDDEEDMLAAANAGDFGLVGAIFTRDLSKAFSFGERLDCGLTVVNDSTNYWEFNLPFGGAAGTQSGRGRLGGRWVLDEFTQVKSLVLDIT